MAPPFRFAICNEIFQQTPFEEACKEAHSLGYDGIELAPQTLADDATTLSEQQRSSLAKQMEDAELEFIGLHWLFRSPPGLHITTPDEAKRKRSWDHVHRLIDLCADLGGNKPEGNGLLVFGSPQQRCTVDGISVRQAIDNFTHELAHAAPHAETRGVTLLVESLPISQTDVVTSLADAVAIVKQIGSPAVQSMFDVHNAVDEREEHAELIRRFLPYIKHVHVNETDGQEPGRGGYDFGSLLKTLVEVKYSGWVSVESFDFSRKPWEIAELAITHLRRSLEPHTKSLSL